MPVEPPANGGYMTAAYIGAAVIYLGYTLRLWRRGGRAIGERLGAAEGARGRRPCVGRAGGSGRGLVEILLRGGDELLLDRGVERDRVRDDLVDLADVRGAGHTQEHRDQGKSRKDRGSTRQEHAQE